jgi:hypothetical protein
MAFRTQDANLFFRDGETAVLADGTTFRCVLEYPEDVDLFGGQSKVGQVTARPCITYPTAAPGKTLMHGDKINVEGSDYEIHHSRKRGDGAFSEAELRLPGGD